jgi:pimeloyl-ACP methyl ester carboxylesterase
MTATTRSVRVGDVSLEIAEAGAGGRPLLMLHGFTGAKEDFTDWFDQLAERGWHVVAPDLRGHGASDHPSRPQDYGLELFQTDVLALVDDVGWDRFVLLGHSMGGMISQAIAVERPHLLDGLVLMDTVPGAPSVGGGAAMLVIKVAARLFGLKAMARMLRKPPPGSPESVRRLYAERPGYGEWTRSKVLATSPVMARTVMAELAILPDRVPELRSLDLPVLVIAGEHDISGFVDGSQRMADAIPGATLAVLPGAAHNPQLETPDAWWATLTTFLDALPGAPSPTSEMEGTT